MIKVDAQKLGEERFQTMIAELEDYAIFVLDINGIVSTWNKGAEKIKGYNASEIIGKSYKIFYPEEDRANLLPEQLLNQAIQNGKVVHEGWRIRKNGRRFWGNVTITALHNGKGELTGFLKVTRDLTERRLAEEKVQAYISQLERKNEALRKSEERYHQMVAEVQDYAILLLNEEGEIENWNLGAAQIKGYQAHEIIGKHFRIFYPPEDLKQHLPEKLLAEARETGRAMHEGWRIRKDGSRFWGSVAITALHDEDGVIIGFTKVTRDLTDRKKAEDALRESAVLLDQKNKTLEILNSDLSSFVYVASHDMKEPLRKIQTYISMFNEPVSEKGRGYLDRIQNGAARLQNLIDDLLSYSQVSNDVSDAERLSLNEIVDTVKHDLEIGIAQRKAIVSVEKLPEIFGVRFQIYQVFLNLLSNALKFSRPDTPPEVHIQSEEIILKSRELSKNGRKFYHIQVSDNGIGFDAENATRIFEVFQRLHPRQAYAGTGIGLSIVKKVMENHQGRVEAESTLGKGSTFHLYFPVPAS